MCVGVCELPSRVQLLHLRAIGGERPASIRRARARSPLRERQVQPRHRTIGQHQRAVVRLDERAAARSHDHVPNRQQLAECQRSSCRK